MNRTHAFPIAAAALLMTSGLAFAGGASTPNVAGGPATQGAAASLIAAGTTDAGGAQSGAAVTRDSSGALVVTDANGSVTAVVDSPFVAGLLSAYGQ